MIFLGLLLGAVAIVAVYLADRRNTRVGAARATFLELNQALQAAKALAAGQAIDLPLRRSTYDHVILELAAILRVEDLATVDSAYYYVEAIERARGRFLGGTPLTKDERMEVAAAIEAADEARRALQPHARQRSSIAHRIGQRVSPGR